MSDTASFVLLANGIVNINDIVCTTISNGFVHLYMRGVANPITLDRNDYLRLFEALNKLDNNLIHYDEETLKRLFTQLNNYFDYAQQQAQQQANQNHEVLKDNTKEE